MLGEVGVIVPLLYIRTDADTCRCLQSVSVPLRQALLQDEVADENEPAAIPEEVWADLQEERNLARYSVPVPFVRQNSYKWGGCAIHPRNSLQPHLTRSGPQRGIQAEMLAPCRLPGWLETFAPPAHQRGDANHLHEFC